MMAKDRKNTNDRVGMVLYIFYLIVLALSVFVVVRVLYLQYAWQPNPRIERQLTQSVKPVILEPNRGSILSDDGRPLAMSFPRYQVYIDCRVRDAEFKKLKPSNRRDSIAAWKHQVSLLSKGLEEVFAAQGKNAAWYEQKILSAYDKGSRSLKLGKPIEKEQWERLKTFPLANKGRNKGGVWVEPVPTRRYPYGNLARRTLGSIMENEKESHYSGIDGKFNYTLHGTAGKYYVKQTDMGYIRDFDSTFVASVDGNDVRTTLNIDYQDITDMSLRRYITDEQDLEGACCVLMEVKTGAVKAMVNLVRDAETGNWYESNNVAVLRQGEPGSVWKITTLMTAIEDGLVTSLDQTIPCNGGYVKGYEKAYGIDKHLTDYQKKHHTENIPLRYCVAVSSNNAFRYLAISGYEDRPEEFIGRLFQYQLGTSFDFDVFEPITTPSIRKPSDKGWHKNDLGQVAMGYGVGVTPMHLLTYYNAIANKGKMMKPYLVEDIEKDGKVIEKFGPSVLNPCICKESTAEMITEALSAVTDKEGTAWRLGHAKCQVSGKTGTANIWDKGKYTGPEGHKQQGTFVGFFPSEDPQYSIICTIYTKMTKKDFFGGVIPVKVVRDIINSIYDIDPYWNENI